MTPRPLVLAAAACAALLTHGATGARAAERPNVLLILADNWRWPTAGALGDPMALTPTFDRVVKEGVLFTHVFNPVPSCSPTRASLLTGKVAHQLGERANLWSAFPKDTPVFTNLLRDAGYEVGYCGKPWGPGNYEVSGWEENPVGPRFADFAEFHGKRDAKKPFFFWLGNTDTATRGGKLPYLDAAKAKLDPTKIRVPPELPDCAEVRKDLMNYYGGVMKLDEEAAAAVAVLEKAQNLDDTVVIYTSDNGWQMPRGLANCYDAGSRVPLAVRWGKHLAAGRKVDEFVSVGDLGPTVLDLAGVKPPPEMTLASIKTMMLGKPDPAPRDAAFIERERHADVRRDHLSYPVRAVRTRDFLYVRNLRPDRWPAGDPDVKFIHDRPYGDVDTTLVKDVLLAHLDDPAYARFVALIFAKRPAEELYDLKADPHQVRNVAGKPEYAEALKNHRARLDAWMKETQDPRLDPSYDGWDTAKYHGGPSKARDK
ncbi:sulfatase : N-sulfoglucosamine sulfohydrolase OS=Haliscomenobacter hydrossis (strain ATCC 27775 / DSM 1100 / LMG 10767 / O) GN=Halhy_6811 PE=4 SV=1: Sulfatase: Sulfatase [Gemmataceae bacterium]|nr:sulfatase : N-sulfoglucosamine sulfohydrolase OS=Haliscomenobacter hydrossis (strain ATCC 27775 / DSM 1100 / LMG 10767 / O) GN=Halhy_6811 PE=4 SV=1: Sulfatase: Sulfatase [Gemmataceae bacterium]VTU02583.1 sulfatase : N-sulfoglucosamine sulfohydrolase OS=Haliscomenobacter hydrossis (strain ATCC 27775 / DSM 1100 / LMG 10767 / O) GN=Halhy_6811 PE=4 SV=1: Sulfatase: Sulfatase [Gemmataceae bacterium]